MKNKEYYSIYIKLEKAFEENNVEALDLILKENPDFASYEILLILRQNKTNFLKVVLKHISEDFDWGPYLITAALNSNLEILTLLVSLMKKQPQENLEALLETVAVQDDLKKVKLILPLCLPLQEKKRKLYWDFIPDSCRDYIQETNNAFKERIKLEITLPQSLKSKTLKKI